jgi:hypothetical protein
VISVEEAVPRTRRGRGLPARQDRGPIRGRVEDRGDRNVPRGPARAFLEGHENPRIQARRAGSVEINP